MQQIDQDLPDEQLADDMQFRDSRFHPGRTMVAVKEGRDVCWNCHTPIFGKEYGDVPLGTAWIRICTRPRCSAHAEEEIRGPRTHQVVTDPKLKAIKSLSKKLSRGRGR